MAKQDDRKTQITIVCKDGSKRVINPVGMWNIGMATDLGKDLEDTNFKYAVVHIL
jgi:hypothetical protein